VTWAVARAGRLLSLRVGTRFDLHAAPGTEGKIARLLLAAGKMQENGWELALVVDGKPATAVFSAAPHHGGAALLGSLVPEDYGAIVGQVTNAMAEIVSLQRDTARQKKVIEQRHLEVLSLNRSLEDSMSAVKAMHAELEDRADALRQSLAARGRVVSNVSHELRVPLHSMLGLSQMLLDEKDGPLNSEQRKQLSFIRQGAEQLAQMVDDLLDLSKIESGTVLLRPTSFTVAGFFSALRGMLAPLARPDSGVRLVFDEPPEISCWRPTSPSSRRSCAT
jgi:signal transduction histidine kinase